MLETLTRSCLCHQKYALFPLNLLVRALVKVGQRLRFMKAVLNVKVMTSEKRWREREREGGEGEQC